MSLSRSDDCAKDTDTPVTRQSRLHPPAEEDPAEKEAEEGEEEETSVEELSTLLEQMLEGSGMKKASSRASILLRKECHIEKKRMTLARAAHMESSCPVHPRAKVIEDTPALMRYEPVGPRPSQRLSVEPISDVLGTGRLNEERVIPVPLISPNTKGVYRHWKANAFSPTHVTVETNADLAQQIRNLQMTRRQRALCRKAIVRHEHDRKEGKRAARGLAGVSCGISRFLKKRSDGKRRCGAQYHRASRRAAKLGSMLDGLETTLERERKAAIVRRKRREQKQQKQMRTDKRSTIVSTGARSRLKSGRRAPSGIRRETVAGRDVSGRLASVASARRETVVASGGSGRLASNASAGHERRTTSGNAKASASTSKLAPRLLKCNDTDEAMKRVPSSSSSRRLPEKRRSTVKTRRRDTLRKSATGATLTHDRLGTVKIETQRRGTISKSAAEATLQRIREATERATRRLREYSGVMHGITLRRF